MIESIIRNIKKNWGSILSVFLWLCIWGGYATDFSRFSSPGFPGNALDLFHGLRSFLPFVALIVSGIILFKNNLLNKRIFATPLGLFGIFTVIGLFSSVFSKNPLWAFYWGVLYGIIIVFLLTIENNKGCLKNIIRINWVIAGGIAIALTLFFFVQPGAIKSLTFNFLICNQRPYETLGNIPAGINTLGIMGTRPTGLGRYAGVVAIVALAGFLCTQNKTKRKIIWIVLFTIFLLILMFSKGKTEIISFAVSASFIFWLVKKINIRKIGLSLILLTVSVLVVSFFIIFYNIPCTNSFMGFSSNIPVQKTIISASGIANNYDAVSAESKIEFKEKVSTLSGRTTIWHDAWHLFIKNPLLGFGFQADRIMLDGRNSQNSLVHALLQAGILGTIPFVLAFILTFIFLLRLFKNRDIEVKERNFLIMISAILVFFAVSSFTESVAVFQPDWLFIAPIIAYIQCLNNEVNARDNSRKNYINFLGNKISIITAEEAVEKMSNWIKLEKSKIHWIVGKDMHGAVEGERHADLKYVLSYVDLFLPDGISLLWFARLKGAVAKKRVSGVDLMPEFFKVAEREGFSNYFYGDTEETLLALNKKLLLDYPNLKIAGFYSPPFRSLTEEEDKEIIQNINNTKSDVLWVGLGVPKQEKWIFEHREKLNVPVVMGVGAGFKFLSGKIKRAPEWIGNIGFEWLWRFLLEPKRMWKRIFIDMPTFMWLAIKDLLFENN